MKEFSKNAIIIIGNGFDLAHGMPTSYGHFADYYLKDVIVEKLLNLINNKDTEEDNSFFKDDYITFLKKLRSSGWDSEIPNYMNYVKKINDKLLKYSESKDNDTYNEFKNYLIKNNSLFIRLLKNEFLGKLYYREGNRNWFNIERTYFNEMHELSKKGNTEEAKQLNSDFKEIKEALKKYLETIEIKKCNQIQNFFVDNFIRKTNIYVINFNYTATFSKFYKENFGYSSREVICNDERTYFIEVNNIHGTLKEDIIFGYGDDTSKESQDMKNRDYYEYIENFKTFSYLMTNRYSNILDKIESFENYETYVIGHSLGRTDKTLLKEIFDNEKCLNIHLFKRADYSNKVEKEKDFNRLSMNISRIMSNDRNVRKKVILFSQIGSFPTEDDQNYHRLMKIYRKEKILAELLAAGR